MNMDSVNDVDSTFLWPAWSRVAEGQLIMKVTGYKDGYHWTGERRLGSEVDPFWSWMFANRCLFPPVFREDLLPKVRDFFNREFAGARAPLILPPPATGNYLYVQPASHDVEGIIASVFARCGRNQIKSLDDKDLSRPEFKIFSPFCRGFGEVFCIRNSKCEHFDALAEGKDDVEAHMAMLERHLRH